MEDNLIKQILGQFARFIWFRTWHTGVSTFPLFGYFSCGNKVYDTAQREIAKLLTDAGVLTPEEIVVFVGSFFVEDNDDAYAIEFKVNDVYAQITNTYESAENANDAEIHAQAFGGIGPYTYALDGGAPQANGDFTGLGDGEHTLVITDSTPVTPLTRTYTVTLFVAI